MAAAWLGGKSSVEKWGGASTLSCELPVRQQCPAQLWGHSSGPAFKSTKDGSGPGCLLSSLIFQQRHISKSKKENAWENTAFKVIKDAQTQERELCPPRSNCKGVYDSSR